MRVSAVRARPGDAVCVDDLGPPVAGFHVSTEGAAPKGIPLHQKFTIAIASPGKSPHNSLPLL